MTSFDYIQRHFLTLQQVSDLAGVAESRIREMQATGCLPGPAYRVSGTCRISSIFGDHQETIEHEYYPRSHVTKVQVIERSGERLEILAERRREAFFEAYKDVLKATHAREYGMADLFNEKGDVAGSAANALLYQEWRHYLDGTYGLCTKSAATAEIALKEATIARIKALTGDGNADSKEVDAAQLLEAVERLDQVSAPFAPHERARSSRGKYIDAVRVKYLSD